MTISNGSAGLAAPLADSGHSYIDVSSPADGRCVGRVQVTAEADVADVARRLRAAQPAWEDLGPKGRCRFMIEWLNWIMDNNDRLVSLAQDETGKSWGDAAFETLIAMEVTNYYTRNAAAFLGARNRMPHGVGSLTKKLTLRPRPYPLVGVITPWNGPIGTQAMDAIPALIAGSAVLSKPSEVTPLCWTELVRAWDEELGAPPVIACVNGYGPAGAAVVDEVDMVMFTGSVRTGRRVAARAGERLIPCALELGGKDAMIVLSDADIDRAVGAAVWGGMHNSGQACISVERVYVEAAVYEQFVNKLSAKVEQLRVGTDAPGSFTSDIGAMATADQIAVVERHVEDALAKGARALTGGKRKVSEGWFFEPTVLVGVDHSMTCMRDETFGPTIPVMKVDSETEAIRLANESEYGLSSSVWTSDSRRAERVAHQLEAGSVNINNVLMSAFQFPLPMGGWKQSGIGARFGGPNGLLKYCRQQSVVSERVSMPSEPHWYPYEQTKNRRLARLARLLGAHGWRRRLGLVPKC